MGLDPELKLGFSSIFETLVLEAQRELGAVLGICFGGREGGKGPLRICCMLPAEIPFSEMLPMRNLSSEIFRNKGNQTNNSVIFLLFLELMLVYEGM